VNIEFSKSNTSSKVHIQNLSQKNIAGEVPGENISVVYILTYFLSFHIQFMAQ